MISMLLLKWLKHFPKYSNHSTVWRVKLSRSELSTSRRRHTPKKMKNMEMRSRLYVHFSDKLLFLSSDNDGDDANS